MSILEKCENLYCRFRDTHHNIWVEDQFKQYLEAFEKSARPRYQATRDMKKEYRAYFSSFGFGGVSTRWMEYYYSVGGQFDRRYIADDLFNLYIDPYFPDIREHWQHKAYQPKLMPYATFPHTLIKCVNGCLTDENDRVVSDEQALAIIRKYPRVVFKSTTYTGGGCGVEFADPAAVTAEKLHHYGLYPAMYENYIVQEVLEQSEQMAQFNPTSVNTDKILSFYFQNEVHILSAHVRMGLAGSEKDNTSDDDDNPFVGIDQTGRLDRQGVTSRGERKDFAPSGVKFEGIRLDFHTECLDLIRRMHPLLPQFPIISWDFAQRKDGTPVLIEYNLKFHSLIQYQLHQGPIFKDMTDEVLKHAARVRMNNGSFLYQLK